MTTLYPPFDAASLSELFAALFEQEEATQLVGGADEPLYQPAAEDGQPNRIYFTKDYFASALHEVAHWCIAGSERRRRVDYGYWYSPDGRDPEQQRLFEAVEIKPQALEWMFCVASGYPFRVSADNLSDGNLATADFKRGIWAQTQNYCQVGMPNRAARFAEALHQRFAGGDFRAMASYQLHHLR